VSRAKEVLALIDPKSSVGLEIGPLDRPIVRPTDGEIHYVDHATTDELKRKYATHANVDKEKLVQIDHVWGETTLSDAVGPQKRYDYMIASHVIEHVPDLIGWLREARDVLRPGGLLSLVIPDKRFTFDVLRRTSTLAEAVAANIESRRTPSPHQIYDHYSRVVYFDLASAEQSWAHPENLQRKFSDETAYSYARKAHEAPTYIDVHAWVFTPASFFALYGDLARLGLIDFSVARFSPRTETGNEFYVTLRALASVGNEQTGMAQIASIPPGFPSSTFPGQESFDDQEAEVGKLRVEARLLEKRLTELLASRSWRVTAPLRWLASRARRLSRFSGRR